MTGLFKPKVATPAAAPAAPTEATPEVQAAADAERRRQRSANGKAATMLSGGSGSAAPSVGTSTLLGG